MAEFTNEQIENAARAFWAEVNWPNLNKPGSEIVEQVKNGLRAAAPLLPLPWVEPTPHETDSAWELFKRISPSDQMVRACMVDFVRRRNAALLPKPVDPRREAVADLLWNTVSPDKEDHEHNQAILEAYDRGRKVMQFGVTEPDPHTGCVPSFYQDSMLYPDTAKMPQPREPFQPNQAQWKPEVK